MLMEVQLIGLLYAILSAGYQSKTSLEQLEPEVVIPGRLNLVELSCRQQWTIPMGNVHQFST